MTDAKSETTGWQLYSRGDVILEFDAPVAAIDHNGNGRMTRSQYLRHLDLFCYLPPLPRDRLALAKEPRQ